MNTLSKALLRSLACLAVGAAGVSQAETRSISNPLPESAVVQFVVASGRTVHEGEALVVLDATPWLEKRRAAEVALQTALAEAQANEEKIAPLEAANAAALATAADEVNQAERMLKRFVEGDARANELTLILSAIDAKADFDRQQERYTSRDKLLASGCIAKIQYNAEEVELTKTKYAMEIAQLKLDSFEKYEKPQLIDQFTNQVAQKKKAQANLQTQCVKNVKAAQAALQASKEKVKSLTEQRDRYSQWLEKTAIYAPSEGRFYPGNPEQPEVKIEPGALVGAAHVLGLLKKP